MTVISLALWSFFLIRPLVLFHHPEFFKFILLYHVTLRDQIATLLQLAVFHSIAIGVSWIVFRTIGHVQSARIFRADEMTRSAASLLPLFIGTGVIYLAVSLLSVTSPELGEKILGLTELALPVKFTPVYAVALVVLRKDIEIPRQTMLLVVVLAGTYLFSQLFQGSKSFVLELAFIGMFMLLIFKGDFVMPVWKIVQYSALGLLVFISFPVAMAVRRISSESGFGGMSISAMIERIQFMASSSNYDGVSVFVFDLITKRLNGYDGLIASVQIRPNAVPSELSVGVMVENAIAAIIPGFQSGYDSFGQITSQLFYAFLTAEDVHGGGIGSYAMLSLFAHNRDIWSLMAIGIYSAACAAILVFAARLRMSMPLRVSAVGALVMAYVVATSGGNFDRSFRDLVAIFFHATLVSYYLKVRFSFAR